MTKQRLRIMLAAGSAGDVRGGLVWRGSLLTLRVTRVINGPMRYDYFSFSVYRRCRDV